MFLCHVCTSCTDVFPASMNSAPDFFFSLGGGGGGPPFFFFFWGKKQSPPPPAQKDSRLRLAAIDWERHPAAGAYPARHPTLWKRM